MSVVGVDLGNLNTVIAVARNRGIDVICNEVSNRATPSLVGFGDKNRYLGESAKTQEISNFKDTVGSLKRLIGKRLDDPDVQIEKAFLNCELVEHEGMVAVKVKYLGEDRIFTITQVVAMFLSKIKEITQAEVKAAVSDIVLSVPGYFDDFQRRALLDASEIAGLNCLKLMNELTASALGYGITKTDLPEDKARNVCFVDIGHSSYSVGIVSFLKGKLEVKGCAYDRHFGGRNFDEMIVQYCCQEAKTKYKLDIEKNMKALFRLRIAAERAKKILSANSSFNLTAESIMNDIDLSIMVTRSQFEEWAEPLLSKIPLTLEKCLEAAKMTVADIDSIEIVGGTTRIPSVKERISKFFGKDLSTTLNQDEAISRGCALQCAISSPAFKVREFSVTDVTTNAVHMSYDPIPEQPEDCGLEVFTACNTVPCTKLIAFDRKESFEINVHYVDGTSIGKYTVKNITPVNGGLASIKVKARLNPHGIVGIEGAQMIQPAPTAEDEKKVIKVDLPVEAHNGSLSKAEILALSETEIKMVSDDKLVADTLEKKNALEEYIYDLRTKIGGSYRDFVEPKSIEMIEKKLVEMEDWLYGEGEDTTKSVYLAKLEELKKFGVPMIEKYRESEERPQCITSIKDVISQFIAQANSADERLAHISQSDRQKVLDKCTSVSEWLRKLSAQQDALAKHAAPALTCEMLKKERESLVKFVTPILTQPKPKPAEPATPAVPAEPVVEEEMPEAVKSDEEMKQVPDMDID